MDSYHVLSLLGLALRGGNLAVGEEPVEAAARARDARLLLLASDAADNTRRRVEHFAEAGQCLWLRLPFTKAELGRAVGRSAVAVTAVTDTGLADALAKKLAAMDPERYGEAAGRMEVKARRAAQRRAEQRAHERNRKNKPKRTAAGAREKEPPVRQAVPAKEERFSRRRSRGAPVHGKRNGGRPNPYAHSRPVKKGKGSFRRREDGRS